MSKQVIIAFAAGGPGSGKDTLFDLLVSEGYQVENIKFADKLTQEVQEAFPCLVPEDFLWIRNDPTAKDHPFGFFAIDQLGDFGYKRFLLDQGFDPYEKRSCRWHLIEYGTNYVRKFKEDEDRWLNLGIRAALEVPPGVQPIITDCRFPNELEAIQAAGGLVIYIDAPWVSASKGGIADGLIKPEQCDHIIRNQWGNPRTLLEQFNEYHRLP